MCFVHLLVSLPYRIQIVVRGNAVTVGATATGKYFREIIYFSVFDTALHTFLQADPLRKRRLITDIYLRVSSLFRKFVTKTKVSSILLPLCKTGVSAVCISSLSPLIFEK